MNRQQHLTIGVFAFIIYSYIMFSIVNVYMNVIIYVCVTTIIGSVIPDILEAPTSWMHRGLGHSKRALMLTGKIFIVTTLIGLFSSVIDIFSVFFIVSGFFLGYVFHLLADATTTVGLPD